MDDQILSLSFSLLDYFSDLFLPLIFTVVADTPYARVLTHTFFPANTLPEASTVSTLPHVTNASLPMQTLPASTPPVESFFSPLSLLPHSPSSMSVLSMMNSTLSVGREFGATNPEWNLHIISMSEPRVWCLFASFKRKNLPFL